MRKLRFTVYVLFLMVFAQNISAAIPKDNEKIPMDTAIRYGVLPNGLTYYIRHNHEPKNRADFYIAQKVGSILEEENQRGLAHFLEHMAFNGTTHFPEKNMLNYLQDNGLRFGNDINAYTGFDNTVYYISNVPTTKQQLMDSVMLALYDWGNEISLLDEEINKERGVINEEWRTRGDAQMRMFEKVLPEFYKGSKYANRLPIGTMDVVMNFKPKELRDYYDAWYRPDQQGIIIVGDFDAAQMEKKVIEMFSKSKMPANPKERKYFPVPDNKKPIYAFYKDPESPVTTVYLFFKHDVFPEKEITTMKKYRNDVLNILTQLLFKDRFNEISQKADSPFSYAFGYDDKFFISATKDAYTLVAAAKEGKSLETFESLLTEAQRVRQHGFTQTELDRAKAQLKTAIKNQYLEKDKSNNSKLSQQYVDHFTDGGAMPSVDFDYQMTEDLLPTLTLKDVNNFFMPKLSDKNVVIGIFGPDKENIIYPTEKQVLTTFNTILKQKTEAYIDKASNKSLLKQEPTPGAITSKETDSATGVTTLKLSNGATVYLKPTDFKNDEILMSAISLGGRWAYKGELPLELKALNKVVGISALGNYNRIELGKYLADKNVDINFAIGDPTESVSGSSSKKDLETLFKLNYALFTDLNKDDEAFEAYKSNLKSSISSNKNNPRKILSDSITKALYGTLPLYAPLEAEEVDKINYDIVLAIARDRLSNAGDFSFSFVGNFDVDSISPLIAKYIASIPDNGRKEAIDYKVGLEKGIKNNIFNLPMENPKTTSYVVVSGPLSYSLKNDYMLDMLGDIMQINYTNTIREEEGGTYGVGTSASLDRYNNSWSFVYNFDTNVDAQERLNKRAISEFETVLKKGADESIFKKVKEASIKQYEISLRKNDYWITILRNKSIGIDIYTGFDELIKNTTLSQFDEFVKTLSPKENKITVIMNGVAK